MAKVNWDNLYFFEDIEDLHSIFNDVNFVGTFDPMNTLLKDLDILADISYMFFGSKFDDVIINEPISDSIISCEGMFKGAVGNSVKFCGFDFSNIGEFEFGINNMFELSNIKDIYIDKFNIESVFDSSAVFEGLVCNRLKIDNIDISNLNSVEQWFCGADINKLEINNFTSYSLCELNRMFCNAHIHCGVNLSGLHGPIRSAIYAFENCIIDGELNLSHMNFSSADTSGMLKDSKIKTLNLIGTFFFDAFISSPYSIASIFSGMEVDTIKIKENDRELLYVIQQKSKKIGEVVLV